VLTCGPMSAKRKSSEDEAVDGDATLTKKKKILQRYRDLYHEIWLTFTRSQHGEYYVRCTTCSTDFSCSHAGKNDCKRHIKSKTHKELSALQKSNRSMSSFLTKSSTETDNQRAVTRAEILMCELIAKYIIYISISLSIVIIMKY
jgi:hypothetical protein